MSWMMNIALSKQCWMIVCDVMEEEQMMKKLITVYGIDLLE